jgi:hypothetical protein
MTSALIGHIASNTLRVDDTKSRASTYSVGQAWTVPQLEPQFVFRNPPRKAHSLQPTASRGEPLHLPLDLPDFVKRLSPASSHSDFVPKTNP